MGLSNPVLTARVLEQNLVVETEAQLRHSREENTHLDRANDFTPQNSACSTNLASEASERKQGHTAP